MMSILSHSTAMFHIFVDEIKNIFKDRGVVILVILAVLVYPLLYCSLYLNETLVDVPVVVVDASHTRASAEFTSHLDATRDVKVAYKVCSMLEAKLLFNKGNVHGIIHIPANFDKNIHTGEQAVVSVYSDMSSFLYYRALILASNYVSLDMGKNIQVQRLAALGVTGEQQACISNPIPYESVILYNQGMGFASFLMPAILILIIHQTLFFGIGMAAGTAREENRFHVLVSSYTHRGRTIRVILGKALAFFSIYLFWSVYLLAFIPWLFNLPHSGNPLVMLQFIVPFLLASIFFSMTVSVFVSSREIQMVLLLFFSLILLFLSGISWPQSNISHFWKAFGSIFPATFGIQAYYKINSMGAGINEVKTEQIGLWLQTLLYLITTIIAYYWQINKQQSKIKLTQKC
ncbi:MAG: ABC transporter [Porphyromonadaceae bacterium CG2_30_38_12]|nr:MAG: ABC transporter [Porphyromonadaceae bacterium CG2_30_38_12]